MTLTCPCGCGQVFEDKDSRGRTRRFVSGHNSRVDNPHRTDKISGKCDFCGNPIIREPSYWGKGKYHFCDRRCKAKWIGGKLKNDQDFKDRQSDLIKSRGNRPPLHLGANHWNWKGGIAKDSRGQDYQYLQWRKSVLRKFNYTCQMCGVRGGKLSAHHLEAWSRFPEKRYDLENGSCLHYICHMQLHGLA